MCKRGSSALDGFVEESKVEVVCLADETKFIVGNSLHIVQDLM